MSRDPHTVDLKKLIEYILKKFFKSVKENSLMLLEVRNFFRSMPGF